MEVQLKIVAHKSPDWEKAVKLREEILRKPLGSFFSAEELDEEKNHNHVVGFLDGKLVATAVLVPEGKSFKMQRVVVEGALRNANIGSNMMVFCADYGRSKSAKTMYCHARDSAVNFYLKNGYSTQGDYFNEDGIPHVKMSKTL